MVTKRNIILVAVCVFVLLTPSVEASQWVEVGPFGGPIGEVQFSPKVQGLVYAATDNGGIFVSTNDGLTWAQQNNGLNWPPPSNSPIFSLLGFAFGSDNPGTVYAFSENILYRFEPTSHTWIALYTTPNPGSDIQSIAVDPFNASHILLSGDFIYKVVGDTDYFTYLAESMDGGVTWTYNPNLFISAQHIEFSGTSPGVVFASSPCCDMQRSMDGGETWLATLGGNNFALPKSNPNTVYGLGTELSHGNSTVVYRSDDTGTTWHTVLDLSGVTSQGIYVDPHDANIVYVPVCTSPIQQDEIYKTIDGGATWTASPVPFLGCLSHLTIDPSYNQHVLAGLYDLYSSWDAGNTFDISDTGLAARSIVAIQADNSSPPKVYVGEYEAAADTGQLFRSVDGGAHWQIFDAGRVVSKPGEPSAGASVISMAMDWFNPAYVYVGSLSSIDILTPGSTTWTSQYTGDFGYNEVSVSPTTSGLIFDAYAPSGGVDAVVIKSTDYGATWQTVSDDLPVTDAEPYVYVAQSYLTPNLVYRAEYTWAWKSLDGGATWSKLSGTIPLGNSQIFGFLASPLSDNVLLSPNCDWISRSDDGGTSWQNGYSFSPPCASNTIYTDPNTPGTIFAGTNPGLVVSTDDGLTWNSFSATGLENHNVSTINHPKWNSGFMYAGTFDTSAFTLGTPSDLEIAISGNGTIVSNGIPSGYEINVSNVGSATASPVALDIVPPANSTLAVTNANGATCSPQAGGAPGEILCELATLSAGTTWSVFVNVTPAAFQAGALMANVGSGEGDINWTNNETAQVMYTSAADFAVAVTPLANPAKVGTPGQLFTVAVTNNGPAIDSANVSISYSSTAQNIGPTVPIPGCVQITNGYTCVLNSIPVGNTTSITFAGSIISPGAFPVAASVAPVNSTDPDSSNNSSSAVLTAVPLAPIASNGSLDTKENTPADGTLVASGSGPLTFDIADQPKNGQVSIANAGTGTFSYTPNTGFTGIDNFTFTASNAGGASNVASESITVQAEPGPPPPPAGNSSSGGGGGSIGLFSLIVLIGVFLTQASVVCMLKRAARRN